MTIARINVFQVATAITLLITMPACTREAKKERAMEAAVKFFDAGDYAASEIELKNALNADPGNAEAIKRIGIIRARQGASLEAAGTLTQAKKKLPNDDEVGVELAKSLMGLGFIPDSRKVLFEVLDRSPSNGEALMQLAESSLTPEWMEEFDGRLKKSGKKTSATRISEALIALRRGSIDSGTALVDEVLKSDPKMARAHALKSSILISKKMPDEALAELKLAADSAGSHSNESIAYAKMLMARDRREEAVAYLEKITTDTPDFLPAWSTLGQIAYSKKEFEKATQFFAKVISENPFDITTSVMQAEIWVQGKEAEKAVDLLEKVTTTLPSRPALDLALAKCYLAANNVLMAGSVLDRALAASPELTEAGNLRAQIYLQDGKTSEAIAILEVIRAKEPKDAVARDLMIQALRILGRNEEAVTLLREKSEADDANPQSRVELGKLLNSLGKFDEARSIFEDTVETFSENLEAVTNLAAIDLKQGKPEAAVKRIDDYIAAHPDSSEALTFKAGLEMNLRKFEMAETTLKKAIDLKADNAPAYALLLKLKCGPGQEAEALPIWERYLKAFPKDPSARLQRGLVLQQLGRTEDARTAFTELIEAFPEFAPGYNNLASLESDVLKDLESAVTHARKARLLDPAHPAIADTLGWIEWQLGNFPAALTLETEAAAKMPDAPGVLYHLGMAQYSMGQSREATESFTKALGLGTDFPEKADTQKQLNLLREVGNATLADLEKRVADNPKDVMSRLQIADLLARAGKPDEALAAYQQAFEANPAIPTALVGEARLYAGPLKSPEKALAAATKARELAPTDPQVLAVLGSAKLEMGDEDEAYGLLKDAVRRLENDFSVAFDYASAAYSLGRIAEARAAMTRVASSDASAAASAKSFLLLTDADATRNPAIAAEVGKALAADPQNVPALMIQGLMAAAAGKSPETSYLEVLKLHPRFDPARVGLAAFYMEDPAKLDEALSLATKARSSMPDDQELTRVLAITSFRKGDSRYAAQLLTELSTKRPLVPGEQLVLGLALAGSNQPEKARQALAAAVAAGLSEEDSEKAKAALSKLDTPAE